MRCKKHLPDFSSSIGVCASCLRERLVALIAAQAQAQVRAQAHLILDDRRKSDPHPPPLLFPRSVSPYVSCRKSDNAAANNKIHHHHRHSLSDLRFYSTPQVGPTGAIVAAASSYKKKYSKFAHLFNLFRSKSEKFDADRKVSDSNSADLAPSSSWFSSILSGRRKKQSRLFSLDESTTAVAERRRPCRDRGMSPARHSNDGEDEECGDGTSGYASESPQAWKQTPVKATPVRRGGGGGRVSHVRNVSGLAFCLSPLVRASPSRQWSQKGMPPETSFPGEIRVPAKPHLSTAASFCANRSRKLADFGRSH